MYQKFIINQDDVLKFGHMFLHCDLLAYDDSFSYGGGRCKVDENRRIVLLYGRSFDFGPPSIGQIQV